ncbi:neuroligin-4, Y-linked-like [Mercenaria mercenaria]|uniref:neuroligin-4, Y-linked-like n=1 Tax=Mercenaria mercenaria TaxID=6596 RepID=UPI00234EB10C|nr:neuroligin-4, Y-linked-like [Mercenaria mercenaria]
MMWNVAMFSNILYFLIFIVSIEGVPVAKTKYGLIKGQKVTVQFEEKKFKIVKFLGIPYAKPPVGDLRFRKPEMISSLPTNPFEATTMGAICPQTNIGVSSSEDCLFLNIYAPLTASKGNRKPVMIYIHGGGFIVGFSDLYDGSILSAYGDVILVSMNYRLGPLGFFHTKDNESLGNYGLWDQQLAIQWVSEHIEAFGGDNTRITIFGHSAGGSSVVYQALYPGNDGLFKRAIAQSGTVASWAVNRFDSNFQASMNFATYAGCGGLNSTLMLQCLRNITSADMTSTTEAYQALNPLTLVNKAWNPVLDNEFVLTATVELLQEIGDTTRNSKFTTFKNVDLMIGATNLDGNVFLPNWLHSINTSSYAPTTGFFGVTSEQFEKVIVPMAAAMFLGEQPCNVTLDAVKAEYTAPDNLTRRLQNLIDIGTDSALNAPSVATARAHRNNSTSTYMYQFATAFVNQLFPVPPVLLNEESAGHADDLGFVFGFPGTLLLLFGVNPVNVTDEQKKVSKAIMTMWTNFAKTGNPNAPVDLQSIYSGLQWPLYETLTEAYLKITPNMNADSVKTKLAERAVEFWNDELPGIQSSC